MSTPPLLDGIKVVDFSQFLSGPYCSLRMLDLGAEVLKVENPDGGDLTRRLYLSGATIEGDSTLFHAINRGKDSIALDLKNKADLERAKDLVRDADVVIQNFRPGVIERLGLGYEDARAINPRIVYGSISGYGPDGPWSNLPGQDLLAQARSGIMWLNGDRDAGPVPIGVPVADIMAGAHLTHGILAALYRRERHGIGALVETSLLEAMVDLQFEFLTTYLNNGERLPRRLEAGSAHRYQPAPYGLYAVSDGHIALAMGNLRVLADALDLKKIRDLLDNGNQRPEFDHRDSIRHILAKYLAVEIANEIIERLSGHGIWCARVLTWDELLASPALKSLGQIHTTEDRKFRLVKTPLRIDGQRNEALGLAPRLPKTNRRV